MSMCAAGTPGLRAPIPPELLPPAILEHFRRPGSTPKLTLTLPEDGLELKALLYQWKSTSTSRPCSAGGSKEKAAALLGLNAPAFRKALRERFPDLLGEAVAGELVEASD